MHLKKIYRVNLKIKIVLIVFILLWVIIYLNSILKNIGTFFLNAACSEAVKISTIVINDAVTEKINNKLDLSKLYTITKNKDDEIQMIDYNPTIVNNFVREITDNIKNGLIYADKNTLSFYIPFGSIFNNAITNNLGPNIPVKIQTISSVLTSITTNVTEYGINNSLIELILHIEIKIKVVLPIISKEQLVVNDIPIAYKIVTGKIPEYYGSSGINKNSSIYSIPLE